MVRALPNALLSEEIYPSRFKYKRQAFYYGIFSFYVYIFNSDVHEQNYKSSNSYYSSKRDKRQKSG